MLVFPHKYIGKFLQIQLRIISKKWFSAGDDQEGGGEGGWEALWLYGRSFQEAAASSAHKYSTNIFNFITNN